MIRGALLGLTLALALAGCRADPPVPAERDGSPSEAVAVEQGLPTIPLTVESAAGAHSFTVEVARSPEEQARGLMFRPSLDADRGMLFPFDPPRPASFWMRNTLIPLDMIFVREDGMIANIARETEPYSLDSYDSEGPVIAVLEIAGGRAAALGIEPGDRVEWDDSALADAN